MFVTDRVHPLLCVRLSLSCGWTLRSDARTSRLNYFNIWTTLEITIYSIRMNELSCTSSQIFINKVTGAVELILMYELHNSHRHVLYNGSFHTAMTRSNFFCLFFCTRVKKSLVYWDFNCKDQLNFICVWCVLFKIFRNWKTYFKWKFFASSWAVVGVAIETFFYFNI